MQHTTLEENIIKLTQLVAELQDRVNTLESKPLLKQEWLTISEACKVAGVSNNTFSKYRENGLPVSRVEGSYRINIHDLNKFLRKFT